MSTTDLTRIKGFLLDALQQEPGQRESFLRKLEGVTEQEVKTVLDLLAAHQARPTVLDQSLPELLEQTSQLVQPGDVIASRYEIGAVLSLRPESQVYLAADLRLAGNPVVVKFPIAGSSRVTALQDQLWREISSLSRLHHPAVSGLIDTGNYQQFPFLVMQYRAGVQLNEWLNLRRPGIEERRNLFLELLDIVAAIHKAGLIHLDLKPQNLLVAEEPGEPLKLSVLDFGISSVATSSSSHSAGTPVYAAPERAAGMATKAADVYSLGRIALDLNLNSPRRLGSLWQKTLARDPSDRPQDAIELRQQVEAVLEGQRRFRRMVSMLIPAAMVLAALIPLLPRHPEVAPIPELRQLTSLRGTEDQPTFSPDGSTVYFAHGASPKASKSIYAIPFAGGEPRLLFSSPSGGSCSKPVPTPDGASLIFLHEPPDLENELLIGDSKGGSVRRLFKGSMQSGAAHPSGRWLYFSSHSADGSRGQILRYDLASGKLDTLTAPPTESFREVDLSLSPDGTHLAFSRFRTLECADLFLWRLNEDGEAVGEPIRLTNLDQRVHHPRWSADGRTILFTAGTLTLPALHRLRMNQDRTRVEEIELLKGWGERISSPATASKGTGMVMVQDREDCDIYRLPLNGAGEMERWISSTALDEEPRFSPDGKSIAFFSERGGDLQGWVVARNAPESARKGTQFDKGEKAWPGWNASGAAMFFARLPRLGPEILRWDPPLGSSPAQRVFAADRVQRIAGLGADGESVLAEVEDASGVRLERWSLVSDRRESLGKVQARFAREFFRHGRSGERIVLYAEPHEGKGLFVLEKGVSRRIFPALARRNTFAYHDGFAYLAAKEPELGIYQVSIETGATSMVAKLDKNPGWGMDVSPDGKELLIALYDFEDSNLIAGQWK